MRLLALPGPIWVSQRLSSPNGSRRPSKRIIHSGFFRSTIRITRKQIPWPHSLTVASVPQFTRDYNCRSDISWRDATSSLIQMELDDKGIHWSPKFTLVLKSLTTHLHFALRKIPLGYWRNSKLSTQWHFIEKKLSRALSTRRLIAAVVSFYFKGCMKLW